MGADADDLAVVMNTSTAMSIVAMSLKQEGDDFNVVSVKDEFPSTTVPFEYQGIRMKYVEPDGARYPVDRILNSVDEKTRASMLTNLRLNREIVAAAKERGL